MKSSSKYYKYIDIIRIFACTGVILYHLNILKGGYLAVSIFFVLSGFLSVISLKNKEKISLKEYYLNKLKKLYLPLIILVFSTITVISFFSNINLLTIKREVISILFGYNNFWQLNSNLDYFARHIDSPFMHLWYISILFQFDLIFPFLYLGLKKIGDKIKKWLPSLITFIFGIISFGYFCYLYKNGNIMNAYYNTLARSFSILFGVSLGFFHLYYNKLVCNKIKKSSIYLIIFNIYLLLELSLFIFAKANSPYMILTMGLSTIVAILLIGHSILNNDKKAFTGKNIIKTLSGMTYEIYLLQYPIIFVMQYININIYLKIFITTFLIIILSYLLYLVIDYKNKKKILRYISVVIFLFSSLYGIYKFILLKDYTKEMKNLENDLANKKEMVKEKEKEYELHLKEEEENWNKLLEELENEEVKLKEYVNNLSIVGVGDSVMLGAVNALYTKFPNGYFNAEISRTAWVVNDILVNLKNKGILGNPVILNLGTNGDCTEFCKKEIIETCEDRKIFWVNVNNGDDPYFNDRLATLAENYNNLYIIDWKSAAYNHPEYFIYDNIHLTETGINAYTNVIYDKIYEVYLEEYKAKKEKIINEKEENNKKLISFYGNDLLLNAFDTIKESFPNAKYVINEKFNYDSLFSNLKQEISNGTLNHQVILAFDKSLNLSESEYRKLSELLKEYQVYIVLINNFTNNKFEFNNIKNIEISLDDSMLMADKIHLTKEGNNFLIASLKEYLDS